MIKNIPKLLFSIANLFGCLVFAVLSFLIFAVILMYPLRPFAQLVFDDPPESLNPTILILPFIGAIFAVVVGFRLGVHIMYHLLTKQSSNEVIVDDVSIIDMERGPLGKNISYIWFKHDGNKKNVVYGDAYRNYENDIRAKELKSFERIIKARIASNKYKQ